MVSVTHEIWRGAVLEPGVTVHRPVVLRVEGALTAGGWAFTLAEAGTCIPWPADVLTAGEREDVERRLTMAAKWQGQETRRVAWAR